LISSLANFYRWLEMSEGWWDGKVGLPVVSLGVGVEDILVCVFVVSRGGGGVGCEMEGEGLRPGRQAMDPFSDRLESLPTPRSSYGSNLLTASGHVQKNADCSSWYMELLQCTNASRFEIQSDKDESSTFSFSKHQPGSERQSSKPQS
jgi:hypothetical protein